MSFIIQPQKAYIAPSIAIYLSHKSSLIECRRRTPRSVQVIWEAGYHSIRSTFLDSSFNTLSLNKTLSKQIQLGQPNYVYHTENIILSGQILKNLRANSASLPDFCFQRHVWDFLLQKFSKSGISQEQRFIRRLKIHHR